MARCVTTRFAIITSLLLLGVGHAEARGKNCLFIGHSFFVPVAQRFDQIAKQAGISGHSQRTVYSRGGSGSPGNLWNGARGNSIRRILASGQIELMGMTYYSPSNSSFEDYSRWIEFALDHNPSTSFFIGLPWERAAGKKSASQVAAANAQISGALANTVSRLRTRFPGTKITYLNYGKSASELNRLFHAGQLPGMKKLSGPGGETVYADATGHGSNLLKDLCALLWLKSLYGVNPGSSRLRFPYSTDIKKIAGQL